MLVYEWESGAAKRETHSAAEISLQLYGGLLGAILHDVNYQLVRT